MTSTCTRLLRHWWSKSCVHDSYVMVTAMIISYVDQSSPHHPVTSSPIACSAPSQTQCTSVPPRTPVRHHQVVGMISWATGWWSKERNEAAAKEKARKKALVTKFCNNVRLMYHSVYVGEDKWQDTAAERGNKNTQVGLHDKVFIVDDEVFYVGSHNLYPAALAEHGVVVDDPHITQDYVKKKWDPQFTASKHSALTKEKCHSAATKAEVAEKNGRQILCVKKNATGQADVCPSSSFYLRIVACFDVFSTYCIIQDPRISPPDKVVSFVRHSMSVSENMRTVNCRYRTHSRFSHTVLPHVLVENV